MRVRAQNCFAIQQEKRYNETVFNFYEAENIMLAWLLAQQIAILFIIIACGFLLVRLGFLKTEDSKTFSITSIYLINPCVIIGAFQIDYSDDVRNGFLLAFAAAWGIHLLYFVVCWLLYHFFEIDVVERASIIYSNAGNLIIPLVIAVLGEDQVIYASAYICVQNILLWTHCQSLMEGKLGANWHKILYNVNLLSILVGMVLFFSGVKLPFMLASAVKAVASLIGPISMIILGMLLASISWKIVFREKRIYLITAFRMLLCPVLVVLFLKYSGLAALVPHGANILLVSLLAAAAPSASLVTQMAQLYGRNAQYASAINVATTLCCIVTMPLMVMLYMYN